jgi:hypothetical protein
VKLYFYRGEAPNFGDELNQWLMPRVFPGLFDEDDGNLFLGIGSVIFDSHAAAARKIVFGSGFGGYTPLPSFGDDWKFYCVRGPRTALACGLSGDHVAGDAAILASRYRLNRKEPTAGVSFIPHFQSIERGNWNAACQRSGITFIDPRQPVDYVLEAIESSTIVITEAMHGAIVSDALRVPWLPVLPFDASHRMKWYDWAEALELQIPFGRLAPSSLREALMGRSGRDARGRISGQLTKIGRLALDEIFIGRAADALQRFAQMEPILSDRGALDRALDRLETAARRIRSDFC